jgi:hypothetical protein
MCLLIALAASSSRSARADSSSVTVLGVRSLDGEDQLERRVSQALRSSARSIDGYRISDREVSLAQMSLAHACEEVDAACLADIATTLSADRLLYGNLVRGGDKVRITLFNFNASTGTIEASAERTVLAAQLADPTLSQIMVALVQRVAGKGGSGAGTLRVTGNRPGAEVSVDGKPVGQLDARGELTIEKVNEGPHAVSVVTSDGRDRRELSVDVRAETTTTLRALLTPPLPQVTEAPLASGPERPDQAADRRGLKRALGWASVGVAAGFAAATIFSWVRMLKISNDDKLYDYSLLYAKPGEPGGTNDACREAVQKNFGNMSNQDPAVVSLENDTRKLCTEADKLEKLQYVFLGGTLVFAGVGTWLLVSSRKSAQASLSLQPSFAPHQASLRASLRF